MSDVVTSLDLTGFLVGQAALGNDISAVQGIAPVGDQTRALLRFQNESGCGLLVIMRDSGNKFNLAAGQWFDYLLSPDDRSYDVICLYVLPNAPVNLLLLTYFPPGETSQGAGVLGNSPIGLSGSVSAVTNQLTNDGNAAVLQFIEATPTSGPNAAISSVGINNDGSGHFGSTVNRVSWDNAGDLTAISLLTGLLQNVSGNLLIVEVIAGNSVFINVNINGAGNYIQNGSAFQFAIGSAGIRFRAAGAGTAGNPVTLTTELQVTAAGLATINGAIASLGGQASTGSFGAPVIVAQTVRQHITTSGLVTVLSFTPAATGIYRASFYTDIGGDSNKTIQAGITWTDPDDSTQWADWFVGINASTIQAFNATNLWAVQGVGAFAIPLAMKTGVLATVTYQRTGSVTVNDFVTAVIERLA